MVNDRLGENVKVLIFTHGSRGDVQPFAALAHKLALAGHEVAIGAPESSSPSMPGGVLFAGFDDSPSKWMTEQGVLEAMSNNYRGINRKLILAKTIRRVRTLASSVFDDMMGATRKFRQDSNFEPDVLVHHIDLPGNEIAELIGIPAVPALFEPYWVPTDSFPNPIFPFQIPSSLNRMSYVWSQWRLRIMLGNSTRWRRDSLHLPYRRRHRNSLRRPDGSPATVIQAFSRHLLPEGTNYPPNVHTTGFWSSPQIKDQTELEKLSLFIADGDRPIFVGFGSMVSDNPKQIGRTVVDAIKTAKVRAIIATGWGGIEIDEEGDDILCLEQAPFDWLFPRVSAIVHHAGSGTTGCALMSGRPQVACPFIGTQGFFARQIYAKGLSPEPILQRHFNTANLAEAIRIATTDKNMYERSSEFGIVTRTEDGLSTALKIVESAACEHNT